MRISISGTRVAFALLAAASIVFACTRESQVMDVNSIEEKVSGLLDQMTLEEKIGMIHASSAFTSGGVERLGIPELIMSDGPHGVRHEHGRDWIKDEGVADSGTYLPVGTALAATWNRDLGYKYGAVLGSEANFRGKDVILGPGCNIIRDPLNGRNFEYLTEDPYLNAELVTGYIRGVQDQGVAACVKHYIANSLEYEREYVDVEMSDRALREIYLPGFRAAVERAGVHTVMAAYNKFRGTYCAHSELLLNDILKEEFGFEGAVISDWNAVKETEAAINAGIDIEMGTELGMMRQGIEQDYEEFYLARPALEMIRAGRASEEAIDDKVRRILRVMFRIGKFGERQEGAYNTPEHQAVARQVADEAIVLLKNEGILPLRKAGTGKVAVVGANATWKHAGAGGSSQVKAYYEVTPAEGLQRLLGSEIAVEHSQGYTIDRDAVADENLIEEAVRNAASADAAIFFGGYVHGYSDEWEDNSFDAEAVDKPDIVLPFGQDVLIEALLEANPNTVIVLFGGGPVDMTPWLDKAKAIVQAWYPGMEGGNALAAVLFGDVNPSGKMPMTFPLKLEDSPAHALSSYPDENLLIDHKEDIFVGYRYFDTYGVEPAFPFGHGLSYTNFEFSGLEFERGGEEVTVTLQVRNTGRIAGAEVVQVYVRDNAASVSRPDRELKGFEKVFLEPDELTTVVVELPREAFQYFDEAIGEWVLEPGDFTILVGSSSRDIRLEGQLAMEN